MERVFNSRAAERSKGSHDPFPLALYLTIEKNRGEGNKW